MARFLLLTITVGLSHDHHQRKSYGRWRKPAMMTRLIRFALLDMNPSVMRLLNTVLLVATPMIPRVAGLPSNCTFALIIRFAMIVRFVFQAIMNRRGQTALRFVAQRGIRIIRFVLITMLLTISAANHPFDAQCLVIDDYRCGISQSRLYR